MELNKIKVLVVATSPNGKGGIASVLQIHKKYKPDLYLISTTSGKGGSVKKIIFLIRALLLFLMQLMLNKVDIIHIHSASYNSFHRKYIFFRIAKWFNKKVLFQVHGAEFHLFFQNSNKKHKIKYLLEHVDAVICLSNEWKSFFEEKFSLNNIYVLNNVVDYVTYGKKRFDTYPIQFLFLGYIDKRKGIWDICEVIAENKTVFEGKIKIKIGGNGQKKKLVEFIEKYNLEEIIEYIGWVDDMAKINCLQESHVYLLPSYNEGLPISILEAMSYSMPIISTKVGGIPNVVSQTNGFLLKPGDKKALLDAISYFVSNPEEIEKMGEVSKKNVKDFSPKKVIQQLNTIYEATVNGF